MQFLYFIPNAPKDGLQKSHIVAAGLGGILRDRLTPEDLAGSGRLAIAGVTNGPGGLHGVILQVQIENVFAPDDADTAPTAVGYYPQRQTWQPMFSAGSPLPAAYIGFDPADLPTPEDLERDTLISGYDRELADGRIWMTPIVRLTHDTHLLPDTWKVEGGKVVSKIKPDWAWAWDLSGQIWDWFVNKTTLDRDTAFDWCARLLSINYRVGPVEIGILNVLGKSEYQDILHDAIAGPMIALHEQQKKSGITAGTDASVNSSAGAEASSPATAPADPNSTSPAAESAGTIPSQS